MIFEFQKQYEIDYAAKSTVKTQEETDKRETVDETNVRTPLHNTTDNI